MDTNSKSSSGEAIDCGAGFCGNVNVDIREFDEVDPTETGLMLEVDVAKIL